MNIIKLGKYRHYRTKKIYEVIGTALHSESLEDMVIYKALYDCEKFGLNRLWTRPANMFLEIVKENNIDMPRFEYLPN